MSLIMKNLFHRNFKGKGKKDCGKMQGKTGKSFGTLAFVPKNIYIWDKFFAKSVSFCEKKLLILSRKEHLFRTKINQNYYAIY